MISGIFTWLRKAVGKKKVEPYDIMATSISREGGYVIPEGDYSNHACDMAENFAVTCPASCYTQLYTIGHLEFLIHNIDQRRFALVKHEDGTILVFELEDANAGVYIKVNQFRSTSYFEMTNTRLIASMHNESVRINDTKRYDFYTKELDPATLAA